MAVALYVVAVGLIHERLLLSIRAATSLGCSSASTTASSTFLGTLVFPGVGSQHWRLGRRSSSRCHWMNFEEYFQKIVESGTSVHSASEPCASDPETA